MDKYEIRYHQDGGWYGYVIYCNGQPFKGDTLRTHRAAVKQAQIELQQLRRNATQQPIAA